MAASPLLEPIGNWDTHRVSDFGAIFHGDSSFWQDISGWDVSGARFSGGVYESGLSPAPLPPSWR